MNCVVVKTSAKLSLALGCALFLQSGSASAGNIERQGDPSQILFERGQNYLEVTAASVDPRISGEPLRFGGSTGNIQRRFYTYSFGYKREINDRWAVAVKLGEPVGASVRYDTPGAFFFGSHADVDSEALTVLAKYKIDDRFSVYGGVTYQSLQGDIRIQSLGGTSPNPYTLSPGTSREFGYLLGVAYEIPEKAIRLALTYESAIDHSFDDNTGQRFDVTIPQSVTLHARTGIAPNTVLFGSARWREWTEFVISPPDFAPNPIASGPSNIWTFELGVGRRFDENWRGAFRIGYEQDNDDIVGNLAGTDGFIRYGVDVAYEKDDWLLAGSVSYIDFGDTNTSVASFSDNDGVIVGVKLARRF